MLPTLHLLLHTNCFSLLLIQLCHSTTKSLQASRGLLLP